MFPVVVVVDIDRPIDEVFAFVTDVRNDSRWWPNVVSSQRIEGDGGVGTRYAQDSRLLGARVRQTLLVEEHEPPTRQVMRTVGHSRTPFTAVYEFAELGPERTRFTMTAQVAAAGPFRLLGPVFAPLLRVLAQRYFSRLRTAF